VFDVAFSPDGKHLASSARPLPDTVTNIWLTSSEMRIWDLDTRKAVVSINKLAWFSAPPAFSPDGKRVAATTAPKTLKVWDAASGRELLVRNIEDPIGVVAFSPDNKRLAVAGWSKDVRILDSANGALVKTCPGELSRRTSLVFSPDGKRLAAGGLGGLIDLWDAESGQLVRTFQGHIGGVFDVAFHPQATRLASAGADGSVRIWDTTSDRDTVRIAAGNLKFPYIGLSPDGRIAFTGAGEATLQPWDATTGQKMGEPWQLEAVFAEGDFTLDGKRLALADQDNEVKVWDVAAGKTIATFKLAGAAPVREAAVSPGGELFACPGSAGEVQVWDVAAGRQFRTLKALKEQVRSLSFSPDGVCLAAGDESGGVKIWELATGRAICSHDMKDVFIAGLRFGPDSKRLAVVGGSRDSIAAEGEIRFLDAESGREVARPLKAHTGMIFHPRFSPDGKRLATGGLDGTVRVWDSATGQETLVLKGHTGMVTGLAFSPDGQCLISASTDGTVRHWDASPVPE
jgi:WD40 repeat protein